MSELETDLASLVEHTIVDYDSNDDASSGLSDRTPTPPPPIPSSDNILDEEDEEALPVLQDQPPAAEIVNQPADEPIAQHLGTNVTITPLQSLTNKTSDDEYFRKKTEDMRRRQAQKKAEFLERNEQEYRTKLEQEEAQRLAAQQKSRESREARIKAKERKDTALRAQIQQVIVKHKDNEALAKARARLRLEIHRPHTPDANNPSGYHEIRYDGGEEYAGDWNSEGQRHGVGSLKMSNGGKYTGEFKEGSASGVGSIVYSDSSRYDGEWEGNQYHGLGVFVAGDGSRFEGQFVKNEPCGFGIFSFSDGEHGNPRMEGEWKGTKLIRRCKVGPIIKEAQNVATQAKDTQLCY
eukprot:m.339974 g.339974  ORF g.339974 m.339974 type:complete len:351 (+) comp19066_c0_seq1:77-1129(+)